MRATSLRRESWRAARVPVAPAPTMAMIGTVELLELVAGQFSPTSTTRRHSPRASEPQGSGDARSNAERRGGSPDQYKDLHTFEPTEDRGLARQLGDARPVEFGTSVSAIDAHQDRFARSLDQVA